MKKSTFKSSSNLIIKPMILTTPMPTAETNSIDRNLKSFLNTYLYNFLCPINNKAPVFLYFWFFLNSLLLLYFYCVLPHPWCWPLLLHLVLFYPFFTSLTKSSFSFLKHGINVPAKRALLKHHRTWCFPIQYTHPYIFHSPTHIHICTLHHILPCKGLCGLHGWDIKICTDVSLWTWLKIHSQKNSMMLLGGKHQGYRF